MLAQAGAVTLEIKRHEKAKLSSPSRLERAVGGQSLANYPAIIQGFIDKGIPPDQISPRENVFTFNAWRAQGRIVRKGEHGVRVTTFAPVTKKDEETGETKKVGKRPWHTTVFHVSQTDPLRA